MRYAVENAPQTAPYCFYSFIRKLRYVYTRTRLHATKLNPRIFTENPALSVYLAEPVADILAVSFTAALFAVRFKKIISELEKKKEGKIPEEK